ncbi:hypothetical protein BVX94_01420 [bacterium B17]|nr:hypothetical protein BVX94_01420 [bacterium B17]
MKILFISTLYPSSLSPTEAAYNRQLICAIAEKVQEVSDYAKASKDRQEVEEEKKDFAQRRPCTSAEARCRVDALRGGETGLSSVSASSASLRETDLSNHSHNVRVIAPVYWLPGRRLPSKEEVIDGIKVTHPRVYYTPGILRNKHWKMYQCSIKKHLKATLDDFKPDHVIIGFAYPDAVAVAPLCREWGVKYSVRVNGSDFRLRVKQPGFREMVLNELNRAPRVFCPAQKGSK